MVLSNPQLVVIGIFFLMIFGIYVWRWITEEAEKIEEPKKSPKFVYPWDDIPWDCDGVDHDHNPKKEYIKDMNDGTYARIATDESEDGKAIDNSSTPGEFHKKYTKKLYYKKRKSKSWDLRM